MIDLSHVGKVFYGKNNEQFRALKDISLKINQGDIFGIIGRSGAGKSTLLRCFNLLERPSEGEVNFNGVKLTSLSEKELRPHRRKIGMIFQHFNLLGSKTVFENVALPLYISGKHNKKEIEERVNYLLTITGIFDKKHIAPGALSGGQKQRVAIARALATSPDVLLCDEATSALDNETTQSILKLLKNINETLGVTIILITHELNVVKSICNRIAVMDHGCIVEQNSMHQFFSNPQSEIGRALVHSTKKYEFGF